MLKIGIIGLGRRGAALIKELPRMPQGATLVAVADPFLTEEKKALRLPDAAGVAFYTSADDMLNKQDLDAVFVATRCSQHTAMALKVLAKGLPLFLEKPVSVNFDEWRRLSAAANAAKQATMVSFPLRVTAVAQTARRVIDSGQLGPITHVQAVVNVPYGEVYYQTWYRDQRETGGMFLQKATHDIDVINYLLGDHLNPARVAAMTSKLIFRGDKPAGLKCIDCGEKLTCPESKHNPTLSTGAALQAPKDDYLCAFAADTGNEDSGNALIEYDNGTQACYSQNFYSRRGAFTRKIRAIGHLGTVEFDWATEKATVWMHHVSRVETYDCTSSGQGHGGGDYALISNFLDTLLGRAQSLSPLSAGLRSALICLMARESATTRTFQERSQVERG